MSSKTAHAILMLSLCTVAAVAAPPDVYYTAPTPPDGSTVTTPNIAISAYITDPALKQVLFNWQGTDCSLYDDSLVLMFNFNNLSHLGEIYAPETGQPGLVKDFSGKGNDGILSDTVGIPQWQESSGFQGAFDFTGADTTGQSILVLDDASLNPGTGDFALCVWVFARHDIDGDILRKGSTNTTVDNWYKLEHSPTADSDQFSLNFNSDTASVIVTSPAAYNDHAWHHVVAQRRGNTAELWVDGALVGSAAVSGTISNSANLAVGSKDTQNDDFINCMLDEVRIYMRSFSLAEIQQLYSANLRKTIASNEWGLAVSKADLSDGLHTYAVTAVNSALESNTLAQDFTIQQPSAPVVTLVSPADENILNTSLVTFTADASVIGGTLTQAVLYTGGAEQTITLSGPADVEDAQISADSPNTNYASGTSINVDGLTPHAHAVVKFPTLFTQVPAGAIILSAQLRLNCTNAGNAMNLYRLTQDWTEAEVAWNTASTGVSWGTGGADGPSCRDSIAYPADCSATGLRTVDVTDVVQAWSDGAANCGILLTDGGTDGIDFTSSETANSPALTVTWITDWAAVRTQALSGASATAVFADVPMTSGNHLWNVLVTGSTGLQSWAPASFNLTIDADSPSQPVLVAPLDGATRVAVPTTLTVAVGDPQNDPLDVSFYGRRAVSTAQDFTIVVLPDTQKYVDPDIADRHPEILTSQIQWIADNIVQNDIVFVAHEGDITDNATAGEYELVQQSMSIIDPGLPLLANPTGDPLVPYAMLRGNHDANAALYNQYFPYTRYESLPWYGGHYGTANDHSYSLISAGGVDLVIVSLSYNPDSQALNWAKSVLQTHADRVGIIVTHSYLEVTGALTTTGGTAIWNSLINTAEVNNVYFVLCGHNHSEIAVTNTVNGRQVHQLLADYQDEPNGGNGFLRLMRFSPANDKVYVQTWSPWINQYQTDTNSQFELDMSLSAFELIATNTGVASGSDSSAIWSDPTAGALNEWFVEVSDGVRATAGPTWTFTPEGNERPVADAQAITTDEDVPLPITLTGSDPDPGDTLAFAVAAQPAHGTLSGTAPDLTYTPTANYNGSDSFTFTVNDGSLTSDPATVSINVTAVPDPPIAGDDTASTPEAAPVIISVLGNDSDPDGDTLSIVAGSVSDPPNGSAVDNGDGTITYTPDPAYVGFDSFAYTVTDGKGGTDTATVTVEVTAVDDPPVAVDDTCTTDEDVALTQSAPGVLGNDTDPESTPLTSQLVTPPTHGNLTLNLDGSFTYTPHENFNGSDTFTYTAHDAVNTSNTAAVSITVQPVNDNPVAVDDEASTMQYTPVDIDVLANDTDVESPVTISAILTQPTNGSASANADGTITYTPDPGFAGQDSFEYTVTDGVLTDVAVVTVDVAAVDYDAYVAAEPSVTYGTVTGAIAGTTSAGDGLVQSITEASNGPAAYSLHAEYTLHTQADSASISEPVALSLVHTWTGGTKDPLRIDLLVADNWTDVTSDIADGQCQAAPAQVIDTLGNIRIRFYDTVNAKKEARDTLTIDLLYADIVVGPPGPVNNPPTAINDDYAIAEDETLTVEAPGVLANDSDVDGDTLSASVAAGPAHGSLILNADGSFSYTPAPNFNGMDSLSYIVADDKGGTDTGTVSISVASVNDSPVAADDAYGMDQDTTLTISAPGLLGNDADVDGDLLTASVSIAPVNGILALNPDGSFIYTPAAGFSGSDSFTYTAADGHGGTAVATVAITIRPIGANTITVASIVMVPKVAGRNRFAQAVVTVLDQNSNPVAGAVVHGEWFFNGVSMGLVVSTGTAADGKVTLESAKRSTGGTFTFMVTNTVLSGYTYTPGVTQGSVTVP